MLCAFVAFANYAKKRLINPIFHLMTFEFNRLKNHALAMIVVLFLPYVLFGKRKKLANWLAFVNGIEISMACIFLEPLFLAFNPFLAFFASSSIWKKTRHATRH